MEWVQPLFENGSLKDALVYDLVLEVASQFNQHEMIMYTEGTYQIKCRWVQFNHVDSEFGKI